MTQTTKHCNTCKHSYNVTEFKVWGLLGVNRQHCNCADYNASEYTHKMLMEDWGKDYCRFWSPKT